jgi:hypothetical protein
MPERRSPKRQLLAELMEMCTSLKMEVQEKAQVPPLPVTTEEFRRQEKHLWLNITVIRIDGTKSAVTLPHEKEFLSLDEFEAQLSVGLQVLINHCRRGMECSVS